LPFFARDGAELYYEVHGDGPPLVLAHGAGGNHMSWWQQVPHFRERYRRVTFAHRGFAPSTDRPSGPGREAFVDDLQKGVERRLRDRLARCVAPGRRDDQAAQLGLAQPTYAPAAPRRGAGLQRTRPISRSRRGSSVRSGASAWVSQVTNDGMVHRRPTPPRAWCSGRRPE
jgi:hypothetical protein